MAKVLVAQSTSIWLALPDYAAERALLKTTGGKLVCFYHQGATDHIVYNTSDDDGATWLGENTVILRTDIGTQDIDGFSVYKDTNDDILFVCNGASNGRIYFRKLTYGAGTWTLGSVVLIASAYNYHCPVICRRSNTDIWVAAYVAYTAKIPAFYSTNEGANWTDKTITPSGADKTNYAGDVDIMAKGTYIWLFVYCRWLSSVQRIRVYQYDSAFDTGTDINTSTGVSSSISSLCALKITDTNIWVAGRTRAGIKIYNYNGSVWDGGTALTGNGSSDGFPTISSVNSLPWMAWIDNYFYVKYRKFDGATWQAAVQLDYTGDQLEPAIALPSDTANFYVSWGDYSTPKNLWIEKIAGVVPPTEVLADINIDTRFLQSVISDINNDIRFSLYIELFGDISTDIRISSSITQDIHTDIRFTNGRDINVDIRTRLEHIEDINFDFRYFFGNIEDISTDIRTRRQVIGDIKEDVRFLKRVISDISTDIRFDKIYYKTFYGNATIEVDSEQNFYGNAEILQPTPIRPAGLTATDMLKGDLIKLRWNVDANYGYNIYTTNPGGRIKRNAYVILGYSGYSGYSGGEFLVGNLTHDVAYTFVVVGVNGEGDVSVDSTSVIATPTFPNFSDGVASRFTTYTAQVKINGSLRADINLQNISLGFGTSPATASFTIPIDPSTGGLPALDDTVECIVNGRSIFKGIIKNKKKNISSGGKSVSYIAYSNAINYNLSSVDWDYILEIKNLYNLDVTDQTWLQAYETVANFQGNYRLYYNMQTDTIEWYQLGTGYWNRTIELGKNILEYDITEDIVNKVIKVTLRGARKKYVKDWQPLDFIRTAVSTYESNTALAYEYTAILEGFNIGDIQVEAYESLGQPEYTLDANKSVVPSDVYIAGSSGPKRTQWGDATKDPKQVVTNWKNPKTEWRPASVKIDYVYETVGAVPVPSDQNIGNRQVPMVAKLTLTSEPKIYGAMIGFGNAKRDGRIPAEDINFGFIHWAEPPSQRMSPFRVSYSYEEELPTTLDAGSGSPSRTVTDTQYQIVVDDLHGFYNQTYVVDQMTQRVGGELAKVNLPNISGRIKILGDETLDLKTLVEVDGQLLDVIRVTHDFTNGFTTDIELTNEKFRVNVPPYQERMNTVEYWTKITRTQYNLDQLARQTQQQLSTLYNVQHPVMPIPKTPYAIYGD